jgi:hypothetical protein
VFQLPTLIDTLAKFYDRLTAENAKLNATVLFNVDHIADSTCELAQVDLYINETTDNSCASSVVCVVFIDNCCLF